MSKKAPSWWSSTEPASGLVARRLGPVDREEAVARLSRRLPENLFLLDMTSALGLPAGPGEMRSEIFGVWDGGELAGVASARPSVALDADLDDDALAALVPYLAPVASGLVKSPAGVVDRFWQHLSAAGRRSLIDRLETSCMLRPTTARYAEPDADMRVRCGSESDLAALVYAARASLREEGRPDPYDGDPEGFQRWVRGRVSRACVVELGGEVAFVGYADVLRSEGCLLQGVYTWPEHRRRGLAAAGVSALCRLAFAGGADHVQLAVVDGNEPAERLYSRLGFDPGARLRTILFV